MVSNRKSFEPTLFRNRHWPVLCRHTKATQASDAQHFSSHTLMFDVWLSPGRQGLGVPSSSAAHFSFALPQSVPLIAQKWRLHTAQALHLQVLHLRGMGHST